VILSWSLRLLCLLLIVCGLLQATVQLILARCAPLILRRLQAAPARRRERILYSIQLAPSVAALFITAAACVPAYVRFEPNPGPESVSGLCLLLASAGALWITYSLLRGFRIAFRTVRFTRACRRSGQLLLRSSNPPVLAVARPAYPVALLGFLRPVIVVSAQLLADSRLRPEALTVALDHERSHALHRDNWKLLSLSFLPRLNLLFRDPWEPSWRAAADWAADDDAVRGDATRSLLLAEALLHAARAVRPSSRPFACTALTSAEAGLAARIDRLLHPRAIRTNRSSVLPGFSAVILLAALSAIAASPWIYSLSESLLHFGKF
jgi:hypothetical protein